MCSDDEGLYPPFPEDIEAMIGVLSTGSINRDLYRIMVESQRRRAEFSQPIEQYDGSLGVSQAFAERHQRPIGQVQWNTHLSARYEDPGNVAGTRWCSGVLISSNLFLTAGHCFDSSGGDWRRPRDNETGEPIPPSEIARLMHVNFNFQLDRHGRYRTEHRVAIEALVEHRLNGLDYAIVRLAASPGTSFGCGPIAVSDAQIGNTICLIGHPAGEPKRIEVGKISHFDDQTLRYTDIFSLGGNSGSPVWDVQTARIVGLHTQGGFHTRAEKSNHGIRISRLLDASPLLQNVATGKCSD